MQVTYRVLSSNMTANNEFWTYLANLRFNSNEQFVPFFQVTL
jgi:hypothetical protein